MIDRSGMLIRLFKISQDIIKGSNMVYRSVNSLFPIFGSLSEILISFDQALFTK